ncbi:hypothetical protein R1A27_12105 [Methylobacterium sp. NMS12]|uniref:hypothetical protein n=1 Tax=Methylobacterium sp. NMS12 TaxID=3079766 RepID=UPI003F881019
MSRYVFASLMIAGLAAGASPAAALSAKDCSVKYQAAKQAGTLNGQKWNDFRKAECGAAADNAPTTAPNPVSPTAAPAAAPRVGTTSAAAASATFPRAVDPKYATESAGKARMHTCLDSYNAAKAAGTLGGMKWIEKGGGYYSACNRQLKG